VNNIVLIFFKTAFLMKQAALGKAGLLSGETNAPQHDAVSRALVGALVTLFLALTPLLLRGHLDD
jgi:hypothetical protein